MTVSPDIDAPLFSGAFGSEQLVHLADPATGLRAVVAIDDTTLGPGLGGVRMRPYASPAAAAEEAQRLAAAMSLKNALAGLPYGGAKSVILAGGVPSDAAGRAALMRRFGSFVAGLGGRYLPGVDMGTTTADLDLVAASGATVTCNDEDPSPWTALGVYQAIRAAVEHRWAADGLRDVHVVIQGAGHVGAVLGELLVDAGARITVSDVDPVRAAAVAERLGGTVVAPEGVTTVECDVFAPCAVARVVSAATVDGLRCGVVAGAANDTLEDDGLAEDLLSAGITYVPDFLANAGGVIQIHGHLEGWETDRLVARVGAIRDLTREVLAAADREGTSPLVTARALAQGRIDAARR